MLQQMYQIRTDDAVVGTTDSFPCGIPTSMTALLVYLRHYFRNLIFSYHNAVGAVARFGICEQDCSLLVPKELLSDIVTAAEFFLRERTCVCVGEPTYDLVLLRL